MSGLRSLSLGVPAELGWTQQLTPVRGRRSAAGTVRTVPSVCGARHERLSRSPPAQSRIEPSSASCALFRRPKWSCGKACWTCPAKSRCIMAAACAASVSPGALRVPRTRQWCAPSADLREPARLCHRGSEAGLVVRDRRVPAARSMPTLSRPELRLPWGQLGDDGTGPGVVRIDGAPSAPRRRRPGP